ncbi:MAG: His/Gly/Thr/Pro-type tRNA ligase C-terminal domain-containing protein, partial [bacterium]
LCAEGASAFGGKISLYIATLGEQARGIGFDLLAKLRQDGVCADMDYLGRSLKAQMKAANRLGAKFVYIIGEDEIAKKSGILKEMKTSEQREIPLGSLKEALQ